MKFKIVIINLQKSWILLMGRGGKLSIVNEELFILEIWSQQAKFLCFYY